MAIVLPGTARDWPLVIEYLPLVGSKIKDIAFSVQTWKGCRSRLVLKSRHYRMSNFPRQSDNP